MVKGGNPVEETTLVPTEEMVTFPVEEEEKVTFPAEEEDPTTGDRETQTTGGGGGEIPRMTLEAVEENGTVKEVEVNGIVEEVERVAPAWTLGRDTAAYDEKQDMVTAEDKASP